MSFVCFTEVADNKDSSKVHSSVRKKTSSIKCGEWGPRKHFNSLPVSGILFEQGRRSWETEWESEFICISSALICVGGAISGIIMLSFPYPYPKTSSFLLSPEIYTYALSWVNSRKHNINYLSQSCHFNSGYLRVSGPIKTLQFNSKYEAEYKKYKKTYSVVSNNSCFHFDFIDRIKAWKYQGLMFEESAALWYELSVHVFNTDHAGW